MAILILDKEQSVPTNHIILEEHVAALILETEEAVPTYRIILEEHVAPLILDKEVAVPTYPIILEEHVAPLILDKEEAVNHNSNHRGSNADNHHQPGVHEPAASTQLLHTGR